MKRYIIDRFEETFAVCEDDNRQTIDIEFFRLPTGVNEGDVVYIDSNGDVTVDPDETRKRRAENKKRLQNLWED